MTIYALSTGPGISGIAVLEFQERYLESNKAINKWRASQNQGLQH
jgi:hypothetical protein